MDLVFVILAALTVVSATGAMFLRNLVHCALCLAVTFAGLAMLYLKLNAQFVGFAQVLVYIGAVAILILFAILLTRGGGVEGQGILSKQAGVGVAVAVAVFGVMAYQFQSSQIVVPQMASHGEISVKSLGGSLMTTHVVPLEAMALLLTAALIGAVVLAMKEKETK